MLSLRSRLVAATMRTSALRVRVPPTRSNSRSCRTRNNEPLHAVFQVTDLVEKESSAVGDLDFPRLSHGTAEGAAFVPEQFVFHESFGNRGAVDGDEGPIPPQAAAMDGSGNRLLSVPISPRMRAVWSDAATRP